MRFPWKQFLVSSAVALSLLASGKAHAARILASGSSISQGMIAPLGDTGTVVSPNDFSSTSFAGYDAIWLGDETYFPGFASRQQDLINFVTAGGNLLAEITYPRPTALSDYPFAAGLTIDEQERNGVHIADPTSPVNAGLTDASLSGWGTSFHIVFLGIDGFEGVTSNALAPWQWVTIVKDVGLGHIVYTSQDISDHYRLGLPFLTNVVHLPHNPAPAPEPGSLALLLAGAAPLLWRRQRRASSSG